MCEMQPIGFIQSLFTFKNGTPRQSSICQHARGSLTIEKSVFNNPEHSLEGLELFSHVWIVFVFHKNNNQYTKAKVKPPRLNGKRVGLFSTRCPYRPNPIGLTLAKIDKIEGATVYLSGIDLLDGTPVLDIKPYILEYDCPKTVAMETNGPSEIDYAVQNTSVIDSELTSIPKNIIEESEKVICTENVSSDMDMTNIYCDNASKDKNIEKNNLLGHQSNFMSSSGNIGHESKKAYNSENCTDRFQEVSKSSEDVRQSVMEKMCDDESKRYTDHKQVDKNNGCQIFTSKNVSDKFNLNVSNSKIKSEICIDDSQLVKTTLNESNKITNKNVDSSQDISKSENTVYSRTETAEWVQEPPINKLTVRFTYTADEQLKQFSPDTENINYRLRFLNNIDEAKSAIRDILKEDPRSVYRRKKCGDSLYFFTVDILHVTCWFDFNMAVPAFFY